MQIFQFEPKMWTNPIKLLHKLKVPSFLGVCAFLLSFPVLHAFQLKSFLILMSILLPNILILVYQNPFQACLSGTALYLPWGCDRNISINTLKVWDDCSHSDGLAPHNWGWVLIWLIIFMSRNPWIASWKECYQCIPQNTVLQFSTH